MFRKWIWTRETAPIILIDIQNLQEMNLHKGSSSDYLHNFRLSSWFSSFSKSKHQNSTTTAFITSQVPTKLVHVGTQMQQTWKLNGFYVSRLLRVPLLPCLIFTPLSAVFTELFRNFTGSFQAHSGLTPEIRLLKFLLFTSLPIHQPLAIQSLNALQSEVLRGQLSKEK
jgi:hypothetical protein